jgi:hypothetical protein
VEEAEVPPEICLSEDPVVLASDDMCQRSTTAR